MGGVSPCLRAGIEPGRVSVVALEAARVAQPLPAELRAVELARPQGSAPDAPATNVGNSFLAAGRIVSIVTILCNA